MLNIDKINKILNSLNLEVVEKNKVYYMLDNNKLSILNVHNNLYEYSFTRDDIDYHIQFNNSKVIINNSKNERLTISNNEVMYEEKEEDSIYNKNTFAMSGNAINFYKKERMDQGYKSLSIKVHCHDNYFSYLKVSETTGLDGTFKKDFIVDKEKNQTIRTNLTRKYNEQGSQITGSVQREEISSPINDYILQQLEEVTIIEELLDQINNFVPDITTLLEENNKQLKTLHKQKQKTIK